MISQEPMHKKMKFSIKDFFSKCDQIRSFLKYAISLQYLKKELSVEVDFVRADKHQSFLQVDTIFSDAFDQACPKYPGKFTISLQNI